MTKRVLAILVAMFVTAIVQSEGLDDFRARKKIRIAGSNRFKYFFLDKEVYKVARDDLADLRIVNQSDEAVPYYIKSLDTETKQVDRYYTGKLVDSGYDTKEKIASFEFQILPPRKPKKGKELQLQVRANGEYSKQIIIEGRYDSTGWTEVQKDTIYFISSYRRESIQFTAIQDYDYYRVLVLNSNKDFKISGCRLLYSDQQEENFLFERNVELNFTQEERNTTTYLICENTNRLRIRSLELTTSRTFFDRSYSIYDTTTDNLRTSGTIFYFESDKLDISSLSMPIEFGYSRANPLVIVIENLDNVPLQVKTITASYTIDQVIFESDSSNSYFLYFGNESAVKPRYDITSFLDYIEREARDLCSLDKIDIIKGREVQSEQQDFTMLFNILIALVSIALVTILILLLFKKGSR
jgi:hypothetical protein